MSFDKNICLFTGTVERFKRVPTKSGLPMICFFLKCWKENFKIIAFKEVAEQAQLADGDRVKAVGRLQTVAWTTADGEKRFSLEIVAAKILPEDEDVEDEEQAPRHEETTTKKNSGEFDYQGGPF